MHTTTILPSTISSENGAGGTAPSTAEQPTQQYGQEQFGQQQFTQQPAPAQPGAGAQPNPETTRIFAIVSFVLGIASVVSGWTIFAPVAGLILGILALRRKTTERTLALWGVWLNGIILGFATIGVLIGVAAIGVGMFALPFIGY